MNASRLDSALKPATPALSSGDLQVQVTGTIGGVLTDLVEIAEWLPVPVGRAEVTARILDKLAGGDRRGRQPAPATAGARTLMVDDAESAGSWALNVGGFMACHQDWLISGGPGGFGWSAQRRDATGRPRRPLVNAPTLDELDALIEGGESALGKRW